MHQDSPRLILWNLFCPRCLHPSPGYRHLGPAPASQTLPCPSCDKPFIVTSRLDPQGAPRCASTPPFIRAPELVEDSDPSPSYR